MTGLSFEARLDRLESLDAIRQLPAKYALALDMRDMDAMANRCFVPDVKAGRRRSKRARSLARLARRYDARGSSTGTSHHVGTTISSNSTETDRRGGHCVF